MHPQQLVQINDLTILIPTYNREHHLKRLLSYYEKKLCAKFIVLDSSTESAQQINLNLVNSLKNDIEHISYSANTNPTCKITDGLKRVTTKYCVLCADDDLLFPLSLETAINFLENNSNFVCVDGLYLNVTKTPNSLIIDIEYSTEGNFLDKSCGRVYKLLENYESLFYGVFRTTDLQNIFNSFGAISELHYLELFQSVASVIIGKTFRIPEFYAMRQAGPPAEPERKNWQTYYWFAENPREFISHYKDYESELWNFYLKFSRDEDRLKRGEFSRAMDLCHSVFFAKGFPNKYIYEASKELWGVKNYSDLNSRNSIIEKMKNKSSKNYLRRIFFYNWNDLLISIYKKINNKLISINFIFSKKNKLLTYSEKAQWLDGNKCFSIIKSELNEYFE